MKSQSATDLGNLVKIYWSLLLGNIVEWYEYAIYGHLAVALERHFFRGSAIGVWIGFGVTFLARPLGGIVLGAIGDKFGRSVAVNISIIGMLIGTCGQGCLPTGGPGREWLTDLSLALLVILRFIQGLSAAGEIVTITTYLTEVSSHRMICRGVALIAVTVNLGFLSAKAVSFAVEAIFGEAAVEEWAWRIPFLLAIIPGMIAVIGRRGIPESGMFLANKAANAHAEEEKALSKVGRALSGYWPNILLGMFGVFGFAVVQYSCFVWTQSFLSTHGMTPGNRMIVGLIARLLQTVLAIPLGYVADIVGIGSVMVFGAITTTVLAIPFWAVILNHPTNLTAVALAFGVGCGTLGLLITALPYYYVVELFPTEIRNTAVGISYNLGFAIFGGLSPVVAEVLLQAFPMGPGVLWAFGSFATLLSIVIGVMLQRAGKITLAHVRKYPYFGHSTFADNKYAKADIKDIENSSSSDYSSEYNSNSSA